MLAGSRPVPPGREYGDDRQHVLRPFRFERWLLPAVNDDDFNALRCAQGAYRLRSEAQQAIFVGRHHAPEAPSQDSCRQVLQAALAVVDATAQVRQHLHAPSLGSSAGFRNCDPPIRIGLPPVPRNPGATCRWPGLIVQPGQLCPIVVPRPSARLASRPPFARAFPLPKRVRGVPNRRAASPSRTNPGSIPWVQPGLGRIAGSGLGIGASACLRWGTTRADLGPSTGVPSLGASPTVASGCAPGRPIPSPCPLTASPGAWAAPPAAGFRAA